MVFFVKKNLLCPSNEEMFQFKIIKKLFLIQLSFSMIINKFQGQTIPNMVVYLPDVVVLYDQLYVALSRGISSATIKVLVNSVTMSNYNGIYTSNVVYK